MERDDVVIDQTIGVGDIKFNSSENTYDVSLQYKYIIQGYRLHCDIQIPSLRFLRSQRRIKRLTNLRLKYV